MANATWQNTRADAKENERVAAIQRVRCATCRNYAWTWVMQPYTDARGEVHHPSCPDKGESPPVETRMHPRGWVGARLSVDEIASRIQRDMRDPYVITWARQVIQAANLPDPRGFPNPDNVVRALFEALKKRLVFVKDPIDTELMVRTRHLLCLDGLACIPGGDCDDQIIALGSAIMACGIDVQVRGRQYAGQGAIHITLLYDSTARGAAIWKCVDPSVEDGKCSPLPHLGEYIVEVHPVSDTSGKFVGVGDPPPPVLGPTETQAWTKILTDVQSSLDSATAKLETESQTALTVRADLGLPPYDEAKPKGEGQQENQVPLQRFASTKKMTPDTKDALAKMLAANRALSQAAADALAGRRILTFTGDDLAIAMAQGDTVKVLLKDGLPTYYDPKTNDPTGQVGLAPIVIGALIIGSAITTLGAMYAMVKVTEYLANVYHDYSFTQIVTGQQNLIAAGKITPEQSNAMLNAASKLAESTKPEKETPWGVIILVGILGAAAGAAGALYLPKLLAGTGKATSGLPEAVGELAYT